MGSWGSLIRFLIRFKMGGVWGCGHSKLPHLGGARHITGVEVQLGTFDPEACACGPVLYEAVVMEMKHLFGSSIARAHKEPSRVVSEAKRVGFYLMLCGQRPGLCMCVCEERSCDQSHDIM